MDWLKELFHNPAFIILAICVGVPVIAATSYEIVKQILRHRERMAMIENGINPDAVHPPEDEP